MSASSVESTKGVRLRAPSSCRSEMAMFRDYKNRAAAAVSALHPHLRTIKIRCDDITA